MEIIYFSANVRQCNIVDSVVHVQLYLNSLIFIYLLCNAFEWDTVEYGKRYMYFPYTREP